MIPERRVVGLFADQVAEDIQRVVREILLQIDPTERIRDVGRSRPQLLGALGQAQSLIEILVVLRHPVRQVIQHQSVVRIDLERGLVKLTRFTPAIRLSQSDSQRTQHAHVVRQGLPSRLEGSNRAPGQGQGQGQGEGDGTEAYEFSSTVCSLTL